MSIWDCCPCYCWGSGKVAPDDHQLSERSHLNTPAYYPGYGGVEVVDAPYETQPTSYEAEAQKTKYALVQEPNEANGQIATYTFHGEGGPPDLKIMVTTASISSRRICQQKLAPAQGRRLGGFLLENCLLKTGEVQRKMAAQALWNFCEQPCTLSHSKLRPEISAKKWTRVEPFDGDRVNLITKGNEGGFRGTITLYSITRKRQKDPHLKVTVCLFQRDETIVDTTRNPFRAHIIVDERAPNATQVALKVFDGEIRGSRWTFTHEEPTDDFLAGVQLDQPHEI